MTPYEAVYNNKPSFGLAHFGIPHEQDLNNYQNETQDILGDVEESILSDIFDCENDLPPSPPSKFPPLVDQYHDDIPYHHHLEP